jgi:hypothetical protein
MRFLRQVITRNLGLKVSALAISLALWAAYKSEPIVEVGYNAPLAVMNLPPELEITSDVPTDVRVRVRGRSFLLRRLTPGDLSVSVDFSHAQAGNQLLRLAPDMVGAPYGAEVVGVVPSEIRVSLVLASALPPERK